MQKEKLLQRLLSRPKDFMFDEVVTLLSSYGFTQQNKGKTSGSRVEFVNGEHSIQLHKPHPTGEMKNYQLKQIIELLKELNYI